MSILQDWTTSELIEFLNSYKRNNGIVKKSIINFDLLYKKAMKELSNRSLLLALSYNLEEGN